MFTGLIECIGQVQEMTPAENVGITKLTVRPGFDLKTSLGDSVAINGCCLTVISNDNDLVFDVSSETLKKTSLGSLEVGSKVNMERAMQMQTRLGGHIVLGHVDGTAKVTEVDKKAEGWLVKMLLEPEMSQYLISKGSVCLDGVSLTINELEDSQNGSVISLMLIPKTVEMTTFSELSISQIINVEVDVLGKYVERILQVKDMRS